MTFPEEEKPLPNGQEPPIEPAKEPEAAQVNPLDASEDQNSSEELLSFGNLENPDELSPFIPIPAPEPEPEPEFDFPRMEADVAAFRRQLQQIEFKPAPVHAAEDRPLRSISSGSRRRRRQNNIIQRPAASEVGERLEAIAQRAIPTVDFFIFAFLAGAILSVGYMVDAPAILLLGVIVAPIMAPWIGTVLAISTGELRFFGQTIGGFLTATLMVFTVGLLAGFASRLFQPLTFSQAFLHARLWWPDLLLLIIGSTILVVSFIQSEEKPVLASLMVAYEFFLPASAAGFGLGCGVDGLWPEASVVFFIHLAISLVISLLVFFYMGFRPAETSGYVLGAVSILISLVLIAGYFGLETINNIRSSQATPTQALIVPTVTLTPTRIPLTVKPATDTPQPLLPTTDAIPTATTLVEEPTVAFTATPEGPAQPTLIPTPMYGRVQSVAGGVTVRYEPDGLGITTVQNGYLVEFLPFDPVVVRGQTWVKVLIRTPRENVEGWVLSELIVTATPFGSP